MRQTAFTDLSVILSAGTPQSTLAADALKRWQDAMAAFSRRFRYRPGRAERAGRCDATTITNDFAGVVGNLQVSQATNRPSRFGPQQLQIQNLMAAQYRATC